ncbi:hypothetical protein BH10PSE2_BH10PSE2_28510 [soil metagenome]
MTDPIEPLRARFRARTATDREVLLSLADGDRGAVALRHIVHGLAGAAGIFGYAALSRAALEIDDLYADGHTPERIALLQLAEAMQRVV